MFELLDIAGAYKSVDAHMIVEKYYDIEQAKIIYILYINNQDNIIEYKWNDNDSIEINKLLKFLKTEAGSYYDEIDEVLFGPNITNISRDISYAITHYEKGFRNKYHNACFDEVEIADKDLSLILNENYGTIIF